MDFLFALILAVSTPCAQEDSENCYWNAAERGNGEGRSFLQVDGKTFYLS